MFRVTIHGLLMTGTPALVVIRERRRGGASAAAAVATSRQIWRLVLRRLGLALLPLLLPVPPLARQLLFNPGEDPADAVEEGVCVAMARKTGIEGETGPEAYRLNESHHQTKSAYTVDI